MTVIAYDGKSIACDTTVYKYDYVAQRAEKICTDMIKIGEENVKVTFAIAGDIAQTKQAQRRLKEYLIANGFDDPQKFCDDHAFVVRSSEIIDGLMLIQKPFSKVLIHITNSGLTLLDVDVQHAFGHEQGQLAAMAAMHAGANAREAVRIAGSLLNLYTTHLPEDITSIEIV